MITVKGVDKYYGTQVLFEDLTFTIGLKEKIGLVGRNGSGKTTLFKLIRGLESPDAGEIIIPKGYRIGALEQHIKFTQDTILKEVCLNLKSDEQYDVYKAEKILFGLGFDELDLEKSPHEISGGYQIRINLAKLILTDPNLLLLDEPTNYLDILSLRWLKGFLQSFRGEVVLITHDRDFMDQVTTHTICIYRKGLKKITGPSIKLFEQISAEEEIHEKTRENLQKKRKEMEVFVDRFRAKASKASQAQSRMKMLEKMGTLDKLAVDRRLAFTFNHTKCPGRMILEARDLSFSYDGKQESTLFENLSFSVEKSDRIAIIGKNGKGKSTLLSLLAGELNPLPGGVISAHPSIQKGYFGQTNVTRLDDSATVVDEIQSANGDLSPTGVRSICGAMMFEGDLADKKIKVLSGGEKSRVLLGKILANPTNILLLDEPNNHLDMESVESLMDELAQYPGAVIIVTHSEMILRNVADKIIVFNKEKAEFFNGGYDEFLKKIGWEEENFSSKQIETGPTRKKLSRKELKRIRSEIVQERSKTTGPLKKEIEDLENRIHNIEQKLTDQSEQLVNASSQGNASQIANFSKNIAIYEKQIEDDFERLEVVSREYEEQELIFKKRLEEVSDE